MNGFRMWTAAHIFVYASLSFFIKERKLKYVYLIFLTPIVHYSFFVLVLLFCLHFFIRNKIDILFYFFITTILFVLIDLNFINNYLIDFLPTSIVESTEAYRVDKRESIKNWYVQLYIPLFKYALYFLLIYIYYFLRDSIYNSQKLTYLFSFSLLLASMSNIFSILPSGGRFFRISFMIIIFLIFYFMSKIGFNKIKKTLIIYSSCSYFFYYHIR